MSFEVTMDLTKIQREQDAFDRLLDSMMAEHAGEFVVIHEGVPLGYYPTYAAAYQDALQRLGVEQTFLVSQVKRRGSEIVSMSWQSGLMFNQG